MGIIYKNHKEKQARQQPRQPRAEARDHYSIEVLRHIVNGSLSQARQLMEDLDNARDKC